MPGNMLRTRKKDANLKPNRILDKRGSRGMLYENEELRIRTIHINDEVEKGHNDIKKLKKENEHLKREIWNLRDEYEKMEEMMQRMCATYGNPENSPPESGTSVMLENPLTNNLDQKYRFKNYRRESEATTTSMYDSEDEELEDMLMIDEDGRSYDSASIVGISGGDPVGDGDQQSQFSCALASSEDSSLDNIEATISTSKTSVYQPTHHHLWQHLTSVPPDLEVVKEESEHTNSNNQSPMPKSVQSESPYSINNETDENASRMHSENQMSISHNGDSNFTNSKYTNTNISPSPSASGSVSMFNPKIEITPAGSPTPSTSRTGTLTPSDTEQGNPSSNANVQNLGCVTLIPKKFQVTSQLRISVSEGQQPDTAETPGNNQYNEEQENGNSDQRESNSSEFQSNPIPIPLPPNHRRFLQNPSSQRRVSQSSVLFTGKADQIRSQSQSQTLSFDNATGLLAQPLSPFYQSEPSLSLNNMTNSSPEVYLSYEDCEKGFTDNSCPGVHSPQIFWPNPNYLPLELSSTVERYLVIGYVEPNPSSICGSGSAKCNYELRDLRAQEIIDELENQFDSVLDQIVGVRVMGTGKSGSGLESGKIQIIISTTNSGAVQKLVEKGLNLVSFKISIPLIDVATNCSLVTLYGVPSTLSNATITSALNQFGQLISPLERRSYKGVDISERVACMHLITTMPSIVNIAGYQIKILAKSYDCQETVNAEGANAGTVNVVQTQNSATHTRSTLPVIQRTARKSSVCGGALTNSISLDQIPRVNQRRHTTNTVCQDETTRMRLMASGGPALVRPSSPSPSVRTNLFLNSAINTTIPTQQIRGGHRIIGRAVSSAPRLENNAGNPHVTPLLLPTTSSILAKRRMSTCSEISEENVQSGQSHSSRIEQAGGAISGPNNPKRPLSRLLRSSPGSLVPPTESQSQSAPIPGGGGGVASKSFYRSLSFDPRRNSNASRCNSLTVTGEPTTSGGSGFGNGMEAEPGNTNPSSNRLLQSQMSHQSQLELRNRNMSMGFGKHQTETQKSLPWCGCWGNGCI